MKNTLCFLILMLSLFAANGQDKADSAEVLTTVHVKAFHYDRNYLRTPAALAVVGNADLQRFDNTSLVPVINTFPGITMEERSPGSYRINIRGSSLRSPFGVRNVKIYYNNIPFTDPGGSSFLNVLGFYNVKGAEIIKGPGSSLYGAGTGGVMLLNSFDEHYTPGISAGYSYGSFNTSNAHLQWRVGDGNFKNQVSFSKLNSDGYRDHTELERINFSWDAMGTFSEKGSISAHFLYGDLYYQTPGGLTLQQYQENPRASRPAAGASPSSRDAGAAIYTKTFMSGLNAEYKWSEKWTSNASVYASYSELKNPAIRNYEKRTEPHFGGRALVGYQTRHEHTEWKFQGGVEFQQGLANVYVNDNVVAAPGAQQSADEFSNRNFIVFAQAIADIGNDWVLTAGISMNKLSVKNNRIFPLPAETFGRDYKNEPAPRISLLRKFNETSTVYVSVARGFSPPSNGEILPSTGELNYALEAENGYNYELGFRGAALGNRLIYDLNLFHFNMQNTITTRRDGTGAEYFVNAGSTGQTGMEGLVRYRLFSSATSVFSKAGLTLAYTFFNFTYKEFRKADDDYSGNDMPGIPKHDLNAALDLEWKTNTYIHLNYHYTGKIFLNDANTDVADAYGLLHLRIGQHLKVGEKYKAEVFLAGNNLAGTVYGSGHDINAFGGRYYNLSPGRSFMIGISIAANAVKQGTR